MKRKDKYITMNKIYSFNTLIVIALFFILQLVITPAVEAAKWELLGITTAKAGLDRDEVVVTARKGLFKKIKIKVRAAPLEMKKVYVHFGNGEIQDVAIRKHFGKGTESRSIDLEGKKRFIKKVVFWYAKKKWAGPKPVVVLLGKH